jgi:nucleotide-binding universal stress UspA family protein
MSQAKIVVGYDEGEQSRDALALAELLGDALGAKLVLAHVYPFDPRLRTLSYAEEREAARKAAVDLLCDAPLERFRDQQVQRAAVPASSPAHGLDQLARDRDAELIVLGSVHRAPMQRVFPGSVALKLLHGGPCPVAVAPRGYASEPHELRSVVAAFDGNEEGRHAVLEAGRIAAAAGAQLLLVAVVDTFGAMYIGLERNTVLDVVERELRERVNHLLGELPAEARCEARLIRGPVTRTLLAEIEKGVDLLVMGSRGYGPLGSVLLGSVSSDLVRQAPCPVLVIPRRAEPEPG